jgi:hypothetical protein
LPVSIPFLNYRQNPQVHKFKKNSPVLEKGRQIVTLSTSRFQCYDKIETQSQPAQISKIPEITNSTNRQTPTFDEMLILCRLTNRTSQDLTGKTNISIDYLRQSPLSSVLTYSSSLRVLKKASQHQFLDLLSSPTISSKRLFQSIPTRDSSKMPIFRPSETKTPSIIP